MSRENVELVLRAYEAWNRQDLESTLDIMAGFEFRPFPGFSDLHEVYRGEEGWRSFWTSWREAWESVTVTVERIEDLGDRLLAMVRFEGVGRGSGAAVSIEVSHLWRLRDGRVAEIQAAGRSQVLGPPGPE